jgi:GTP-binding protein
MAYLGETGLPFVLVFTKVDKLNKTEREAFKAKYEAVMLKQWHKMPPMFITSANKGDGREELLSFIEVTNQLF